MSLSSSSLLSSLCHLLLLSTLVQTMEDGEDGPPHEMVFGDYTIENPNWPMEAALPQPSAEECEKMGKKRHPDFKLDIPEYIEKYNYSLETHRVKTEDGYFLKVFRITGSPLSPPKPGKIPVYLNHGLAGNAWSWLFLKGNGSLAFKAANEGFDVFISNARGSLYSNEHEKFTRDQDEYWDFSFHELGYYDVPAVIDYIIKLTGHPNLYYVGHSLGTMQFLIAMSERPEYNDKIRVGFLLATAGYITNVKAFGLRTTIATHSPVDVLRKVNGNMLDPSKIKAITDGFSNAACGGISNGCGICDMLTIRFFGFNPNQNDVIDAQFFNEKYFSTTATKVFSHLHQSMSTAKFAKYDYGLEGLNFVKYRSASPPSYKLDKISAPTVTYWGFSDEATVPEDVKNTYSKFTPGVLKENNRVSIKSFNHLDFLIAKDVEKYVYNRLIWIMQTAKYVKNVTSLSPSSNTNVAPASSLLFLEQ